MQTDKINDLPDYVQAQYESRFLNRDIMFQQGDVIGVVRYHQGNWYWINIDRLKNNKEKNHGRQV